jgi:hypothetical protein
MMHTAAMHACRSVLGHKANNSTQQNKKIVWMVVCGKSCCIMAKNTKNKCVYLGTKACICAPKVNWMTVSSHTRAHSMMRTRTRNTQRRISSHRRWIRRHAKLMDIASHCVNRFLVQIIMIHGNTAHIKLIAHRRVVVIYKEQRHL